MMKQLVTRLAMLGIVIAEALYGPVEVYGAACAGRNQSCTTKPCCDHLGLTCVKGSCKAVTATTVTPTTQPGVSTTRPSPTTTRPPPSSAGLPLKRFSFEHFGVCFPASSDYLWNPVTGEPETQTEAWARALFLHFVVMPEVYWAVVNVPSLAHLIPYLSQQPELTPSKFLQGYTLHDIQGGRTYTVHANYIWDQPHNWFDAVRDGVLEDPVVNATQPTLTADVRKVLSLDIQGGRLVRKPCAVVPHNPHADFSHESDGILDASPRVPLPPLTAAQCAKLAAASQAHRSGSGVQAAQLAFEESMCQPGMHPLLCTLSLQIFTTRVNPARGLPRLAALDLEKHAAHNAWVDSFNCATHEPPDIVRNVMQGLRHERAHFLRAVYFGEDHEYLYRVVCSEPRIDDCPLSAD